MLQSIPISRLVLYIVLIGLIPIVIALTQVYSSYSTLNQLHRNLETVQMMGLNQERKQSQNRAVRQHFKNKDHFYIDKNVEPLRFLKEEKEALEKITREHNFVEDPNVSKRIEYLESENTITLSEGPVETHLFFTETEGTLSRPIEVTVSDIKEILTKIEGVEMGPLTPGEDRPQLIITDFKLKKKTSSQRGDIFTLTMKVLKREYF